MLQATHEKIRCLAILSTYCDISDVAQKLFHDSQLTQCWSRKYCTPYRRRSVSFVRRKESGCSNCQEKFQISAIFKQVRTKSDSFRIQPVATMVVILHHLIQCPCDFILEMLAQESDLMPSCHIPAGIGAYSSRFFFPSAVC